MDTSSRETQSPRESETDISLNSTTNSTNDRSIEISNIDMNSDSSRVSTDVGNKSLDQSDNSLNSSTLSTNNLSYKYCRKHKKIEPVVISSDKPSNSDHEETSSCDFVVYRKNQTKGKTADKAFQLYHKKVREFLSQNNCIQSNNTSASSEFESTKFGITSDESNIFETTSANPVSPPSSQNNGSDLISFEEPESSPSAQGQTTNDDVSTLKEIENIFEDDNLFDGKLYQETVGNGWNQILCCKCHEVIHRHRNNQRGGRPIKNCERCSSLGGVQKDNVL